MMRMLFLLIFFHKPVSIGLCIGFETMIMLSPLSINSLYVVLLSTYFDLIDKSVDTFFKFQLYKLIRFL